MRGHLKKRSKNSWTIVLDRGRDPATGKRRQQWVSVKGTKRDAERKLAELLHQGRTISVVHFNPIEAYTTVALIFFIMIYPATQAVYWLERRLKRSD